MKTCPFCSEALEDAAGKCRHCGETLPEARPARTTSDDLSEVMKWVFEDPEWVKKLVIGVLCLLSGAFLSCLVLFIPLFAVMGYKVRIMRQQARAPGATPMPDWDDWGSLILDGLKLMVGEFLLVFFVAMLFGLFVGGAFVIDYVMAGKPGPFTIIAGSISYFLFIMFAAFVMQFLMPALELEYLLTGSPLHGLHFRSLWRRVSTRPGDYFMLFIYHFVAGMIGGVLAILLYAPVVWSWYTQGAIIGRWVAQQRAKDAALGL